MLLPKASRVVSYGTAPSVAFSPTRPLHEADPLRHWPRRALPLAVLVFKRNGAAGRLELQGGDGLFIALP